MFEESRPPVAIRMAGAPEIVDVLERLLRKRHQRELLHETLTFWAQDD